MCACVRCHGGRRRRAWLWWECLNGVEGLVGSCTKEPPLTGVPQSVLNPKPLAPENEQLSHGLILNFKVFLKKGLMG